MAIPATTIRVCAFDAYGTLFDVNSAAQQARDALGEKWRPLAEIWRAKQLQYTWLRSLMGRHADFWQVTQGIEDLAQVKAAYIEANGTVTVIKRDDGDGSRSPRRRLR